MTEPITRSMVIRAVVSALVSSNGDISARDEQITIGESVADRLGLHEDPPPDGEAA